MLIDKLEAISERREEVERMLAEPANMADIKLFAKLNKEYKDLKVIVEAYHRYKKMLGDIAAAKEILANEKDPDLIGLAKDELAELEPGVEPLEEEIRNLLVPKDPEDGRNAVLEIRAGTGGDEASIFAGDLYRMYWRYCEAHGFKVEVVALMRKNLKNSSWRLWRERVHGRKTKFAALRSKDVIRFKCDRQRSISGNKVSKR